MVDTLALQGESPKWMLNAEPAAGRATTLVVATLSALPLLHVSLQADILGTATVSC